MVKCIAIDNACIDEEYVELKEFTETEGHKIIVELGLDFADITIKDNVMVIAHEDGQMIFVRQDSPLT